MLKLFVDSKYTSPYAMSVFVALHEKQLPFTITTIDLEAMENKSADYAVTSITCRVPTLQHDGFALSESSAITEYIDEVFSGAKLYPIDKQSRARARQIQAWIRSDLMPIRQERSTEVIFYGKKGLPLSNEAQDAAKKLFAVAELCLKPGSNNLFDEWCIADTDLALMLQRLIIAGDPVPKRLVEYANYQWQKPSVQLWVNTKRP